MVDQTLFAVAQNDAKPVHTGCLFLFFKASQPILLHQRPFAICIENCFDERMLEQTLKLLKRYRKAHLVTDVYTSGKALLTAGKTYDIVLDLPCGAHQHLPVQIFKAKNVGRHNMHNSLLRLKFQLRFGKALLTAGKTYDIVLLDIDMDGLNGIETARRIRETDKEVKLIYITNYSDYTIFPCSVLLILPSILPKASTSTLTDRKSIRLNSSHRCISYAGQRGCRGFRKNRRQY